jgi:hypothetical protein
MPDLMLKRIIEYDYFAVLPTSGLIPHSDLRAIAAHDPCISENEQ